VGTVISVQESAEHYEFFHQEKLVARHQKAARHSVVMEPAHYAGLPHQEARVLEAQFGDTTVTFADFTRLPTH
jgi:hypothetical protein